MAENQFKNFASAEGAQIMSQTDYEKKAGIGVVPGIADPEFANKTWHQSALMASAIGHVLANDQDGYTGINVTDDQTTEQIAGLINKFVKDVVNELIRINPDLARLATSNTFTQENIFNEAVTFAKNVVINGIGKNKGVATADDDIVNLGALNAKITALNLAQYVTKAGNQTITGQITFSKPVVGVNGTANNHLITKAQFDAGLKGAGGVPVGSLVPFAGKSIPNGYLLCNGAAVSRTTYAALFAVIGTTYGAGDGSKTFTLPDFRNRFIEGSTTAGTRKNAGLPNILGSFSVAPNHGPVSQVYNGATSGAFGKGATRANGPQGNTAQSYDLNFNASSSNSTFGSSSTVQPASLSALILIKI